MAQTEFVNVVHFLIANFKLSNENTVKILHMKGITNNNSHIDYFIILHGNQNYEKTMVKKNICRVFCKIPDLKMF